MLVTLKQMMNLCEAKKCAAGAFNTPNLEGIIAVLSAAEEMNVPVIIQHAQGHEQFMPIRIIGPIMLEMAKRAKVPVCVHLDHGEDLDYVCTALDLGFTSVMYDGSVLSLDENIANTKLAVSFAKQTGASVEAEIGCMGKRENGSGSGAGSNDPEKIYTDPKQAKIFVEETGIDALACSFGTTHGVYLSEPKLDFSVVENVRKMANIPVVMHGGSGVSPENFRKAIEKVSGKSITIPIWRWQAERRLQNSFEWAAFRWKRTASIISTAIRWLKAERMFLSCTMILYSGEQKL